MTHLIILVVVVLLVERISTGKLARTCLFDAERGRLYVPVPRQTDGTSPELRVFQAKP